MVVSSTALLPRTCFSPGVIGSLSSHYTIPKHCCQGTAVLLPPILDGTAMLLPRTCFACVCDLAVSSEPHTRFACETHPCLWFVSSTALLPRTCFSPGVIGPLSSHYTCCLAPPAILLE